MYTAIPCGTSYSTRQGCDNGSDEDVKERCGGKTLQTLKEKIIVERKRKGLEEMPDILEPPKTYKMREDEIEKDRRRKECNRRSANRSRARQKEEMEKAQAEYDSLQNQNMDLDVQVSKMMREKQKLINQLKEFMNPKEIEVRLAIERDGLYALPVDHEVVVRTEESDTTAEMLTVTNDSDLEHRYSSSTSSLENASTNAHNVKNVPIYLSQLGNGEVGYEVSIETETCCLDNDKVIGVVRNESCEQCGVEESYNEDNAIMTRRKIDCVEEKGIILHQHAENYDNVETVGSTLFLPSENRLDEVVIYIENGTF